MRLRRAPRTGEHSLLKIPPQDLPSWSYFPEIKPADVFLHNLPLAFWYLQRKSTLHSCIWALYSSPHWACLDLSPAIIFSTHQTPPTLTACPSLFLSAHAHDSKMSPFQKQLYHCPCLWSQSVTTRHCCPGPPQCPALTSVIIMMISFVIIVCSYVLPTVPWAGRGLAQSSWHP